MKTGYDQLKFFALLPIAKACQQEGRAMSDLNAHRATAALSPHRSSVEDELARFLGSLSHPTEIASAAYNLVLPVDRKFPVALLKQFLDVHHEQQDAELLLRHIQPGSRVLQLGGGSGITGVLLSRITGNPVTILEPDPRMAMAISKTFAANSGAMVLQRAIAIPGDHPRSACSAQTYNLDWPASAQRSFITVTCSAISLAEITRATTYTVLAINMVEPDLEVIADQRLNTINKLIIDTPHTAFSASRQNALSQSLANIGFNLVAHSQRRYIFERN